MNKLDPNAFDKYWAQMGLNDQEKFALVETYRIIATAAFSAGRLLGHQEANGTAKEFTS